MKHEKMKPFDIIMEAAGVCGLLACLFLQFYYAGAYKIDPGVVLFHVAILLLLYAAFTVLEIFPEILNGTPSVKLTGKVRLYAVRMVRLIKLVVVGGMLIPSIYDVLGRPINGSYSLGVVLLVLLVTFYYMYHIWKENRASGKK